MDIKQVYGRFDGKLRELLHTCSGVPQTTPDVIILEIGQFLYKGFLEWDPNCSTRFKIDQGVATRRKTQRPDESYDILVSQAVINSCETFTFNLSLTNGWLGTIGGTCNIGFRADLADPSRVDRGGAPAPTQCRLAKYMDENEWHWPTMMPASAIFTIYVNPKNRKRLTLLRNGVEIISREWTGDDGAGSKGNHDQAWLRST